MRFDSLDDVTVLEIGTTLVGPYTTQTLGAFGAEVIKVEPPSGDAFRESTIGDEPMSNYFAMVNADKQSLCLDLKQDAGRETLLELAEDVDVVVENYRPGVVERLGIGYETLSEVADDLVYCSIAGYGQEGGPMSHLPGIDPILQGTTGLMSVTGERGGSPVRIGVAVVDLMTATWSVIAIMNALRDRDRGEGGRFIDMSMFDVGISMLTKRAGEYFTTGQTPQPMGTEDPWTAPYGGYPTKDDEMIILGTAYQAMWERFCEIVGREDLLEDDRFADPQDRIEHRDELNRILEEEFRQRTREEWLEVLSGEIPVGPVLSVDEALESDQATVDGVTERLDHPGYGGIDVLNLPLRMGEERHRFEEAPPTIGEDSQAVLRAHGFSESRIERLATEDVIQS